MTKSAKAKSVKAAKLSVKRPPGGGRNSGKSPPGEMNLYRALRRFVDETGGVDLTPYLPPRKKTKV